MRIFGRERAGALSWPGLRRITQPKTSFGARDWNPTHPRAMVACMGPSLNLLRRVKKLLRRFGASPEDAEDLVQEAVLRLHVYERAGNEIRSPESFVARTALNLAIDAARHAHANLYESTSVENLTIIDTQPRPDEVLAAEERLI